MKNITLVHNVKNVANGNQTFKKKKEKCINIYLSMYQT